MSLPLTPQGFYCTQGNRQVFLQWNYSAGANSYTIQRSIDNGLTYVTIATVISNTYLDTAVTVGVQYYYQVAASNISGLSPYTSPLSVIPTPSAEMSLGQIRLAAQQRADRVNSNFVTLPEWNSYINQAMYELYDLLITSYNDYYLAVPAAFTTNGSQYIYPLPDGAVSFTDPNNSAFAAAPFYKLRGVDLALNTASNAWVTINKYVFEDRNRYLYPNSSSTIYGVFNMQYRVMGSNINFIPTPSASQTIRIWYIPRLNELVQDTDITTLGISGWIEYVKEESDTQRLTEELLFLKQRIEESSINRDANQPDRITDIRTAGTWSGGFGGNGPIGGF